MIIVLYALPVVLFLITIGMMFINIRKHLWFAVAGGATGLLVVITSVLLAYLSQADQRLLLKEIEQQQISQENQARNHGLLLTQLAAIKLQPNQNFDKYTQYGLSIKNSFFLGLDKINQNIQELIAKNPNRNHRNINIYRLPEDVNQLLLANYLRTLGYEAYIPEGNSADNAAEEDTSSEEEDTGHSKTVAAKHTDSDAPAHAAPDKKSSQKPLAEDDSEPDSKDSSKSSTHAEENSAAGEEPVVNGNQIEATSTTDIAKIKALLNFKQDSKPKPEHGEHASEGHDTANADGEQNNGAPLNRPPLASANVLYYGSQVSDQDIKMIALAFMRSGIALRGMRTFKEGDRPHDVELDWTGYYEKRSIISPEKILTKKSFDR